MAPAPTSRASATWPSTDPSSSTRWASRCRPRSWPGLVPALRASRVDATASLGGAARGSRGAPRLAPHARARGRGGRARGRRHGRLRPHAPLPRGAHGRGHRPRDRGRLVLRADPPESRYAERRRPRAYWDAVLERVRALPDVASAGAIHLLPGTPDNWNFPTWPEGVEIPEGTPTPAANFRIVRPGYFETVGLHAAARPAADADADRAGDRARRGGEPGVRRPLLAGPRTRSGARCARSPRRLRAVPGRRRGGRTSTSSASAPRPEPEMYFTQAQWRGWSLGLWLVARMRDGAPAGARGRGPERRSGPWTRTCPSPASTTFRHVFDESAASTRFLASAAGLLRGAGAPLGAVGVFGVTAYAVGAQAPRVRRAHRARLVPAWRARRGTRDVRGPRRGSGWPWGSARRQAAAGVPALRALRGRASGPRRPSRWWAGRSCSRRVLASLVPAWRASRVDPVRVLGTE